MGQDILPPMDPSDPPVERILERAARLTPHEAALLDDAVRRRTGLVLEAGRALEAHQRFLNATAMFSHWPDPALEMAAARRHVAAALGAPVRHFQAVQPDDGSILWGASTAAAYAVLGSGRASSSPALRAAWEEVIGGQPKPPRDALPQPIPQEFSRAAHDDANIVGALMETVCVHPRRWSPGFDWTVAVPVVVGTGIPVSDDAPRSTALRILFAGDDAAGLHVMEPGDVLQGVGGTNGHMLWPPATVVFEVLSGSLAGTRVQFVLDPDPQPAGESAVTAGEVLLRVDEPVLADAVRLADLHATISSAISPRSGA